jgi:large subunit ribosomal protein L15
MKLNTLQANKGARKQHYRVGRGLGSGNGKTSGAGQKGQNSRSGGGVALGFEGGQMPIYRRLPKRGFKNINRVEYAVINVCDLNVFEDGATVSLVNFVEAGLVSANSRLVKVLGDGELTKKLTVEAAKFSKSAQEAIEKAGGKAEVK